MTNKFEATRVLRWGGESIQPGEVIDETPENSGRLRRLLNQGRVRVAGSGPPPPPAPAHLPSPASEGLAGLSVAEIVSGLRDGSLDPAAVESAERERSRPRVTVLRALGEDDD